MARRAADRQRHAAAGAPATVGCCDSPQTQLSVHTDSDSVTALRSESSDILQVTKLEHCLDLPLSQSDKIGSRTLSTHTA